MANYVKRRRKAYLIQMIKKHIKDNFLCYVILLALFWIGFIVGIITVCGIKSVEIGLLTDGVLLSFFNDEVSFLVFLLLRCCYSLVFLLLILIFTLKTWLIPFVWLYIIYRGYCIGFNLVLIFLCLGISGVFCGFLIFLPCWLVGVVISLNYSCILINKCIQYKRYGKICDSNSLMTQKFIFSYFIAFVLINLIECLLVSMVVVRLLIE